MLCVLLYNLLSGGNEVFIANRLQRIDPFVLLLLVFSATTALCLVVQVRRGRAFVTQLVAQRRDVALLNVFTALTWFGFFVALRELEPAIVATVVSAVGPVVMIPLGRWLRPQSIVLRSEVIAAAGIVVALGLLLEGAATGQTAVGHVSASAQLLGFGASLVAGLALVLTVIYAKRLYDRRWAPGSVMAARFWLLSAAAAVAVVATHAPIALSTADLLGILAIILFGTVAPLYVLQIGLSRIEPMALAVMFSTAPVFTLVLQALDARLHWSPQSIAGVALATGFVVLTVMARRRLTSANSEHAA
jgi:drug/metabolite transporter (DMT)-like permease